MLCNALQSALRVQRSNHAANDLAQLGRAWQGLACALIRGSGLRRRKSLRQMGQSLEEARPEKAQPTIHASQNVCPQGSTAKASPGVKS